MTLPKHLNLISYIIWLYLYLLVYECRCDLINILNFYFDLKLYCYGSNTEQNNDNTDSKHNMTIKKRQKNENQTLKAKVNSSNDLSDTDDMMGWTEILKV